MIIPLALVFCYLLGSIPFGLIFTSAKGIDLRKTGSGNIGATNVLRTVGKIPAFLTLLGDMLKGTTAVAIGIATGGGALIQGVLGLSAIVGHDFSVFQKFRGGKGVATSMGVMLIYAPKAGILTVLIWLLTMYITRYSSLSAIISFSILPAAVILLGYPREAQAVSVIITLLLIFRHSANIKRLIAGAEGRIGNKK